MSEKMTISFVASPELGESLTHRTRKGMSANKTARRDLGRFYTGLVYALASVDLAENEAQLICDALNGTLLQDITSPTEARVTILADVEDAIRLAGAAKKWGIDSDKLRATIVALTDFQALAVLDAVERFWATPGQTVQDVGLASA